MPHDCTNNDESSSATPRTTNTTLKHQICKEFSHKSALIPLPLNSNTIRISSKLQSNSACHDNNKKSISKNNKDLIIDNASPPHNTQLTPTDVNPPNVAERESNNNLTNKLTDVDDIDNEVKKKENNKVVADSLAINDKIFRDDSDMSFSSIDLQSLASHKQPSSKN